MHQDLGRLQELRVAAGVIAVLVRVQQVLDRLGRYALHFGDDVAVQRRDLRVDDDDPFVRHADGDVAARGGAVVAGDDVQPVFELHDGRRERLALGLLTARNCHASQRRQGREQDENALH